MSAGRRVARFVTGGALGAAIGTAVAVLFAPQSWDELKGRISDRLRQARLAGVEASLEKRDQLIRKFRAEVEDPTALGEEEEKSRLEAAEAVSAMGAVGLGLNAPGALAAQETALRAAAPTAPDPAHSVETQPADVRAAEVEREQRVATPEVPGSADASRQ